MNTERIERELRLLSEGGQVAHLITNGTSVVIYRDLPTDGARFGLPDRTDVVVPVPPGYAASPIDLAGLPTGSPLLPRLRGGTNVQQTMTIDGRQWQLISYHPHNGGGGPPWDQMKHGFHTYIDHLIAWLHRIC
jgi:Prokaryotic E2 family E